ncbi:unnamed protein product [Acanthoscelides obtectus]|uniref:Uncharacterized protein n=1 Tax=Acanthoscelides obtectus TaxID=200917 RepID=A0A9P0LY12_ACAOB|nr:unnamed protein product [Acanthoscelides obtectus]CAK1670423.1 hypothetical protein AOBTE_LOCUS27627 [Acanthoscelides obtectus]
MSFGFENIVPTHCIMKSKPNHNHEILPVRRCRHHGLNRRNGPGPELSFQRVALHLHRNDGQLLFRFLSPATQPVYWSLPGSLI